MSALGNTGFNAINEELMTAYHQVAAVSMKNAAEEIKSSANDADRHRNLTTWENRKGSGENKEGTVEYNK